MSIKLKKLCVFLCVSVIGYTQAQTMDEVNTLLMAHKYNSATNALKKMIASNPSNGEAYYRLGEAYIESGKNDSARIYFATGTEKVANNPHNFIGLAKLNADGNNLAEARKNTDKAMTLGANKDANLLNEAAEVYIHHAAKDGKYALTLLDQALKLDGKNVMSYTLKGEAYRILNDGTNALKSYDDAELTQKTAPGKKTAAFYVGKGRLYKQGKSFDAAEAAYLESIKLEPNYAIAYQELGDLNYQARKYTKAKEYYDKYIVLAEPTLDFYKQYCRLMFLMKDYATLTAIAEKASKIDTTSFLIARLGGYAAFETKDYPKSTQYLSRLFRVKIATDTIVVGDYEYYGRSLAKSKKDSLAIIAFNTALQLDPSKQDLHADMASSYFAMKKYPKAIEEYNFKITKLKPSANDYIYLGRCYYFEKMYTKADSAYLKVCELAPTTPQGPLWRGYANSALEAEVNKDVKDPKQRKWLAKPYYEQFVAMPDASKDIYKKDNASAYGYLGYYYLQMDDLKKSLEMYQKSLEFDPTNKEVGDAVTALKKKLGVK